MSYWDPERQQWVHGDLPPPPPFAPGEGGFAEGAGDPGGTGGRDTTRALVLALVTLLVFAGIGVGMWLLVRDDDEEDRSGPGPVVPSATESGWPSTTPETTSPPTAPPTTDWSLPSTDWPTPTTDEPTPELGAESEAPSGYTRVEDPAGFTVDVPVGWQRTSRSDGIFYTSPDERRLVQIFTLEEPEGTPYESLEATESHLAQTMADSGYRRLGLRMLGAGDAAELQYAYDHARFGARRVIDRAFTGPDGVQYAVLVAGPASSWPEQETIQETALNAFCPTGYCGS
ncbi:hypothetical protein LRS74_19385 [Streptomyces sp. LX-29]|uniref:hypothetical protein n=1 Tax=Streptomyces sp. LX-29 TaxID=2900152 RepID=UPI00240DA747|nr:hypothetical protein [Streptomyces sp. LX-29]WFB08962.1 hypothetical protein LRS74_19385 [Streptomyces sp. LX-29]